MTASSPQPIPTVSFRTAALAVGVSLAVLTVLTATPLGALLLTDGGRTLLHVLPIVWVAAAAAVDLRGWRGYGPARRSVSFVAWAFFGLSLLAPWIG